MLMGGDPLSSRMAAGRSCWRKLSAECCRVAHVASPPRLPLKKKKCSEAESERVDLAKRLRVPLGHKRDVARRRGGRRGRRFTGAQERSETR